MAEPNATEDLAAIDQTLAADIENLLAGDFETIDTVLDGVFEEKAALVQTDAAARATSPTPPKAAGAAQPPSPAARRPVAPAATPASATANSNEISAAAAANVATAPLETSHASSPASGVSDPALAGADPASPASEELATSDAADLDSTAAADAPANGAEPTTALQSPPGEVVDAAEIPGTPAADHQQSHPVGSAPAKSDQNRRDAASRASESPPPSASQAGKSQRAPNRRSPVKAAGDMLLHALLALNKPIYLLPPRIRPAVDVLAITLLLWVPVVWIMALMLGGPEAAEASHAGHEPTALHDESMNNASASGESEPSQPSFDGGSQ